ncbi:SEC-C metal-binding domain-containing protein [Devosia insulae]
MTSTRRNQPCPCGSGIKYKRCHGRLGGMPSPADIEAIFGRRDTDELPDS